MRLLVKLRGYIIFNLLVLNSFAFALTKQLTGRTMKNRKTMKAICFESFMIFTDIFFVGDLPKAASENLSFQLAKTNTFVQK